jgi:hypothetical protein
MELTHKRHRDSWISKAAQHKSVGAARRPLLLRRRVARGLELRAPRRRHDVAEARTQSVLQLIEIACPTAPHREAPRSGLEG